MLAGLVMLFASAVSYELVQTASAPPPPDVIEMASPGPTVAPASPFVLAAPAAHLRGLADALKPFSDVALLLAAGATLFVAAAGVRRHTE